MNLNPFQRALIARARESALTAPTCTLCHQSHGGLIDGQHAVCRALHARAMPLPTWERCPDCAGLGHLPKSQIGPVNPSQATLLLWAPRCETCDGQGFVYVDAPRAAAEG